VIPIRASDEGAAEALGRLERQVRVAARAHARLAGHDATIALLAGLARELHLKAVARGDTRRAIR
jgi:hypothetical protein